MSHSSDKKNLNHILKRKAFRLPFQFYILPFILVLVPSHPAFNQTIIITGADEKPGEKFLLPNRSAYLNARFIPGKMDTLPVTELRVYSFFLGEKKLVWNSMALPDSEGEFRWDFPIDASGIFFLHVADTSGKVRDMTRIEALIPFKAREIQNEDPIEYSFWYRENEWRNPGRINKGDTLFLRIGLKKGGWLGEGFWVDFWEEGPNEEIELISSEKWEVQSDWDFCHIPISPGTAGKFLICTYRDNQSWLFCAPLEIDFP